MSGAHAWCPAGILAAPSHPVVLFTSLWRKTLSSLAVFLDSPSHFGRAHLPVTSLKDIRGKFLEHV